MRHSVSTILPRLVFTLLRKSAHTLALFVITINTLQAQAKSSDHIEEEILELQRKINQLPEFQVSHMPNGVRPCWVTCQLKDGMRSVWIQFDFGKTVTPDSIALVPDYTSSGTPDGFPKHFTITLSNTKGITNSHALYDYKDSAFEFNPKTIPHFFNSKKTSGRYLTIILYPPTLEPAGKPVFRFSEILVFHNRTNLALNAAISSSLKKIPGDQHYLDKLNDGWSALPLPEDPTIISPCEGFHSYHNGGTTDPQSPYWVQIDLEKIATIDQINLIPVIPKNFIGPDGYHFPKRFTIEGSTTDDFTEKITLLDSLQSDFPNPGNHQFSIGTKSAPIRYIRISVTELERGLWNACFYSIAEVQIISQGLNIAKNCPIRAYRSLDDLYLENIRKDIEATNTDLSTEEIHIKAEQIWQKKFNAGVLHWAKPGLVDGYSSHHKLLPRSEWLAMITKRASLQEQVAHLELLKQNLVKQEQSRAKQITYYSITIFILIIIAIIFWHNRRRKQIEHQLRIQIAQDLHDDLGSDISNISLVSQLLEKHNLEDNILINRIQTIRESASRSLESIRNIILLTQDIPFPMKELSVQLNHIAQNSLSPIDIDYNFRFSSSRNQSLTLPRRPTREIIFIFKEIITNISKHSQADHVEILLHSSETELSITVSDNGIGTLDTSPNSNQLGISSIKKRINNLQGKLSIQSHPSTGSKLTISIPLKQCSKRKNKSGES